MYVPMTHQVMGPDTPLAASVKELNEGHHFIWLSQKDPLLVNASNGLVVPTTVSGDTPMMVTEAGKVLIDSGATRGLASKKHSSRGTVVESPEITFITANGKFTSKEAIEIDHKVDARPLTENQMADLVDW